MRRNDKRKLIKLERNKDAIKTEKIGGRNSTRKIDIYMEIRREKKCDHQSRVSGLMVAEDFASESGSRGRYVLSITV